MSDEDDYRYSSGEEYSEEGEEEVLEKNPKRAQPAKSLTPASVGTRSASSATGSTFKKKDVDYFGVSPEQLQRDQASLTAEIAELVKVPEDHASILLVEFRWDKEKLLDQFYSDPEKTRIRAGAIQGDISKMIPTNATGLFQCPVTYEKVPFCETLSMGCEKPGEPEHRFSLEAWQDYLICRVQDGASCLFTRCQARGCTCVVSPRVWRLVLGDVRGERAQVAARKDALTRYERILSSNYVDMNRHIKWCPAPSCGWAVQAIGPCREVTCQNCHLSFCFRCGLDAHAPLSCKGLAEWNEKCSNESETANWFVANTKKCPNCSTHIEKNQGCNHMHCNMCKYDFCWICLGKWADHGANTGGFYQCNKYDPSTSKKKEDDVSQAKRELDRYIHYYKRYQGHDQSLKYAAKQREQAEARMTELQKKGGKGWIDVQFIMEAAEQLIECRRVLKYTYAYAFQMPDGPRKQLFEFSQGQLEQNTEKLHELSEKDVEAIDRSELINYTRVTKGFLQKLLEEVAREELEGFGATTS